MEKALEKTSPKTIDEKIASVRWYVLLLGMVSAILAGMTCIYVLATMTNSATSNVVGVGLYVTLFGLVLALQTYYVIEYFRLLFEKLGSKE